MEQPKTSSRKPLIIAGVVLLAVVAAVWGLAAGGEGEPEQKSSLPDELSVESLKAKAADPGKLGEVLDSQDRENMTEEQRRELRRNMGQVFRSLIRERVTEYFAAAEADRQAVLDRHIDDFRKRMKGWEQRRKEREQRRGDDGEEGRGWGRRDWTDTRSQEERKADSESRNPDEMAQRMAYFFAVRERMSQRGIEMPWGRRGGRGGGGGRGPGGHGGRR